MTTPWQEVQDVLVELEARTEGTRTMLVRTATHILWGTWADEATSIRKDIVRSAKPLRAKLEEASRRLALVDATVLALRTLKQALGASLAASLALQLEDGEESTLEQLATALKTVQADLQAQREAAEALYQDVDNLMRHANITV